MIHTSLRRGHNMNLLLETAFATLLLLGAGAGIFGLGRAGKVGRVLRLAHGQLAMSRARRAAKR